MTFCKVLAQGKNGPDDIIVYECFDYNCPVPYYQIVISRDGIARLVERTARTTWRKKFKEWTE